MCSSDPSMNCSSHVDMCTPHAMWGPDRARASHGGRCASAPRVNVREPSDHGLIHTGEKARPSRTPQTLAHAVGPCRQKAASLGLATRVNEDQMVSKLLTAQVGRLSQVATGPLAVSGCVIGRSHREVSSGCVIGRCHHGERGGRKSARQSVRVHAPCQAPP